MEAFRALKLSSLERFGGIKCARYGPKYEKDEDKIRKNKLLDYCINGKGDIFKEIKSFRKSNPVVATTKDGVKDDVKDHFKGIYEKLFNSADDAEELLKVQEEADRKVDRNSLKHVERSCSETEIWHI